MESKSFFKYSLLILIAITVVVISFRFLGPILANPKVSYQEFSELDFYSAPFQSNIDLPSAISIQRGKNNFLLYPQAHYEITGKVVGKRYYRTGWESSLSPVDLGLVWNILAVGNNSNSIRFSQFGRWLRYRTKRDSPYNINFINLNSSNNHIIPANKNIRKALHRVRKNQIIRVKGYLVNVRGSYKNRNVFWNTSLTRDDTGDGACEIIYVTNLRIGNKVYE